MNEQQFAQEIRNALEDSTTRLPYRVTHRLEQARSAALARQRTSLVPKAAEASSTWANASGTATQSGGQTLWWRLGVSVLPVLVVALGLFVISVWNDTEIADEIAEIDTAVLTDDVPLAAYTDRGFGVFLKNSRQ